MCIRDRVWAAARAVAVVALVPWVALGGGAAAQTAAFDVRPVLLTGAPAPGFPGLTVADVDADLERGVRLVDEGTMAFYARLSDGTDALIVERGGQLATIAKELTPAPQTGSTFLNLTNLIVGADGAVYFGAKFIGGDLQICGPSAIDDVVLYRERDGVLELLVREDDPFPAFGPDVHVDAPGPAWPNPFGGSVYGEWLGLVTGTCGQFGTFPDRMMVDRGQGLEPLVADGAPSPVPGTVFDAGPTVQIRYLPDDPDAVAYQAVIEGPGVTQVDRVVLIVEQGGQQHVKVRSGTPVPGAPGLFLGGGFGVGYSSWRADLHAFSSGLLDASGALTFLDGLFLVDEADQLHAIAIEGDPAPDTTDGSVIAAVHQEQAPFPGPGAITLGDGGQLAFRSSLNEVLGFDESALYYRSSSGELRIVAREGGPVPGLPGAVFEPLFVERTFDKPWVNREGRAVFSAHLSGPGLTASARGIFTVQPDTHLAEAVLLPGDALDLSGVGTDVRVVESAGKFGPEGPFEYFRPVTDAGAFASRVVFTDGSAAIVEFVPDPTVCQQDLGSGGPGASVLAICGEGLGAGQVSTLELSAPAGQPSFLLLSVPGSPDVPFVGGTLVAAAGLFDGFPLPVTIPASGLLALPVGGANVAFGAVIQFATLEPALPLGFALSNAVLVEFGG